jgi:pimeloyl-ACP methyl ester carboxylesterase
LGKQARVLVKTGFSVLAIDFRGRGQSRGGAQTQPPDDGVRFDVLAAIRYLRQTGAKTVSVVGTSFGGGAAAEASVEARPGEIDRLILLAHSPIDKPEQMKGRQRFILSRDDFSGDNKIPRLPKTRDQYQRASGPKELVILEGSAHAQFIFETEQGERLMRELLRSSPSRKQIGEAILSRIKACRFDIRNVVASTPTRTILTCCPANLQTGRNGSSPLLTDDHFYDAAQHNKRFERTRR